MNETQSWNGTGITTSRQSHWLDKGERECVRLTLEDGRILECTPGHTIMTSNKTWMKANDLLNQRVIVGINYPAISLGKEIDECNGWHINIGPMVLKTDTPEEFMKTLAFCRLIGLLVTDGYYSDDEKRGLLSVESMYDVNTVLEDLRIFSTVTQTKFLNDHSKSYYINLKSTFTILLKNIDGLTTGNKVFKEGTGIPTFIMGAPRPIVREFVAAMFGGDGHTCGLGMHRGKRDIITSICYSRTKKFNYLPSLRKMMEDVRSLLVKCGIHEDKISIREPKEISDSKKKTDRTQDERSYAMTLHLDLSQLIPFYEKIGFRYCAQKTQRLEAGVAYRRLRDTVARQHNWMTERVNELTCFQEKKRENPNAKIQTKKAIEQAAKDLQEKEPILHPYAIPSVHDITDHLIKGTGFGKFASKSFPTPEQFFEQIGALSWFEDDFTITNELPTMTLKVIDIRPIGKHPVYDIQVDGTHNFLANGVVAHNCLISQGCSRFLLERLYDLSDPYKIPVCAQCGSMPSSPTYCSVCDQSDIKIVPIPYAAKLLFQELNAMGIRTNLFPKT
jgi:intein/homing endonuclease